MPHSEYLDLCAAYALGVLDAADQQRLGEHLKTGCPECSQALREFREDVVSLAHGAPPVAPPPELRQRILDGIAAPEPTRTVSPDSSPLTPARGATGGTGWMKIGGALAAVVLIAVAVVGWWRSATLETELSDARARLAQLEEQVQQSARWAAVFTSPRAEIVVLVPTADGDANVQARATYDPSTDQAVLVFDNLRVPDDRTFQLWALTGDGPRSLGLIDTIQEGYAIMRVGDLAATQDFSAFAVSLEPAGGAPTDNAPTGPVVLVGER